MVLDFRELRRGEAVAGIAGAALLVVMLVFSWFAIKAPFVVDGAFGHPEMKVGSGRNAFESFSLIDFVLLGASLTAVALPLLSAAKWRPRLERPLSATVAALGIASVVLLVVRIASPPDLPLPGGHVSDVESAEVVRQIGVWLGLIAAAAVACGGIAAVRAPSTTARRRATAHG